MKPRSSFSHWKSSAQAHAKKVGCPDDLWAEDDPYDLLETARVAYARGQSASDFVEEMFADDIASRAHDALMAADAQEHGEEE